ncbi:hypothetical protein QE152_g7712 [Popillia japonica]|uniref:Uncharacterized protein n=1 Tax=Popillia japonica TaxID=7064 RepID=A0AAW1ME47_POPJA
MAEYKLRSKLGGNVLDEELIADRIVEKLMNSEDIIAKITNKICEKLIPKIDDKLNNIVKDVNLLHAKLEEANMKIEQLEQYSRVNNIRVFGVSETPQEDVCKTFINLCKNKLNIDIQPSEMDIIHRLRGRENGTRPIIVRFTSRMTKKKIFSSKSKLKGTRIVFREDLTPYRLSLIKQLSSVVPSKSVWTSDGKIFCKSGNTIKHIKTFSDIESSRGRSARSVDETTSA